MTKGERVLETRTLRIEGTDALRIASSLAGRYGFPQGEWSFYQRTSKDCFIAVEESIDNPLIEVIESNENEYHISTNLIGIHNYHVARLFHIPTLAQGRN